MFLNIGSDLLDKTFTEFSFTIVQQLHELCISRDASQENESFLLTFLFKMASQTGKFSDLYELKEEIGKYVAPLFCIQVKVKIIKNGFYIG